jgi:alpha-L-fucosidase
MGKTVKRRDDEDFGLDAEMWGGTRAVAYPLTNRNRWYHDSKYGMFIHWGLYSKLAGVWDGRAYHGISEWIQFQARIPSEDYARTARRFNPSVFDPSAWVKLAKEAGMRYIVITAKHHDGFALFKSAASPFNMADATPCGIDALAELAEACRKGGVPLGFYYSQTQDWHEPDALGNSWEPLQAAHDFPAYLEKKALPQIRELLTGYGNVPLLWFDTPGPITAEQSRRIIAEVRRHQPDCLVNSRLGNGLGDYETLGDQEIPNVSKEGVWETIDTHNDTWGFSAHDCCWKSPAAIAMRLVNVVSRGGCYVLNVGPDSDGRIPQLCAAILREVGAWLDEAAEAVYAAAPSPIDAPPWGACTAKGNRLFLHVFTWPADGRLVVPGVFSGNPRAKMLTGARTELSAVVAEDHLTLCLPGDVPQTLVPIVELICDSLPARLPTRMALGGYVNIFHAAAAAIDGCEKLKHSWMEKFGDWKHAECLTGWKDDGVAKWRFILHMEQIFTIHIEYSSSFDEGDATWCLSTAATNFEFVLPPSGTESTGRDGWPARHRFHIASVATVAFRQGEHILRLAPSTATGRSASIAAIRLVPLRMKTAED